MVSFCKKCGKELKDQDLFCTSCGTQVLSLTNPKLQNQEPADRTSKNHGTVQKNRNVLIPVFSIVGIIVLGIAAYFIVDTYNAPKKNVAQTASTSEQKSVSNKKETNKVTSSQTSEGTIVTDYTGKLNALQIHTNGKVLLVGNWSILDKNGTLFVEANSIPSKDLSGIFDLYDTGNLASLQNWAKDVYSITEDLSHKLNKEWIINVSNSCVEFYPTTLSSTDLKHYSGTCGYSIPVLTGNNKENLSLIINSSVFGSSNYTKSTDMAPSQYILPGSDLNKLTDSEIDSLSLEQLRLARNEIYARHGYIFKSEDLKAYFSQKAWYHANASYDGTTLSEVEKYNVEWIQTRERSLQ